MQGFQPQTVEILISTCLIFDLFIIKMLRPIQLNNQFRLITVEIHNIAANHPLPIELNRIGFQKVMPQMPFFPRYLSA